MDLKKVFRSFAFAGKGCKSLIKSENNFQFHIIAMVAVICLGAFMQLNATEWVFVSIAIGLVLISEAFNTAVEKLCDFVHPEHHKSIGVVKDIAAAGVLIAAMIAMVIGLIIFYPKLF